VCEREREREKDREGGREREQEREEREKERERETSGDEPRFLDFSDVLFAPKCLIGGRGRSRKNR